MTNTQRSYLEGGNFWGLTVKIHWLSCSWAVEKQNNMEEIMQKQIDFPYAGQEAERFKGKNEIGSGGKPQRHTPVIYFGSTS